MHVGGGDVEVGGEPLPHVLRNEPVQAVKIHKDLQSKKSVGMHWGTFKLTYENYLAPRSQIREEAERAGLGADKFVAVDIGETVEGAE